jgi:GT2 family glycosyltransferase
MNISAVIPVWNGKELLAKLLPTLSAQTLPALEVIVVDNGSQDGAPQLARDWGATVVSMGHNAGFASAVNRGIKESRGEWIAVLNSDVELAPEYFSRLVTTTGWFATGKILSSGSERIDGTFDLMSRAACSWRVGHGCADGHQFSLRRVVSMVPWTAALFRRELFERVGLLEESFESYLEDVDFGLRCVLSGFDGEYIPEAVAWHRGSATLGRWHPDTVRWIARNQVKILSRHYPKPLLQRWFWPVIVGQGLWGLSAFRHGTGMAWVRGKWEGIAGFRSERGKMQLTGEKVLGGLITSWEAEIRKMQQSARYDTYWRLYFLLTGGGSK